MAVPIAVTWNMQGGNDSLDSKWNKFVKQLVKNYTYVCLQEAGALPLEHVTDEQVPPWVTTQPPDHAEWRYVKWNIGSTSRPENVHIFWLKKAHTNVRVSLAICSLKLRPQGLIYVHSGFDHTRPSIGFQFGPDHVYTLHGVSPGGNDTPRLITNISNGPQPWYALGDYNREPQTLNPPSGTLCPPNKETYVTQQGEKRKYDYMVRFGNLPETGKVQLEGPTWSDHAYVTYGV